MQVRKISLSHLQKADMPVIMDNIINVLKEHDVEKLHLDFMLQVLEKNRLQLYTTEALYVPLQLTPEVAEWHNQRIKLAGSISIQMRGIAQANLENLSEEIKIAQEVVKLYLSRLRKKNKQEAESLIASFLSAVDKVPHVKDAFTQIGLMPYVDELRNANQTHNALYIERNAEHSRRQRGSQNKAIIREAQAAMRSLFEQIDVANRTYPELNYDPLILRLNAVLVRFTNSIKTRLTYNKKRAEKALKEKNAAETEMQLMCVDKKPTGVMIVEKKDDKKLGKAMSGN